jgi:hypothetical protein
MLVVHDSELLHEHLMSHILVLVQVVDVAVVVLAVRHHKIFIRGDNHAVLVRILGYD